MSKYLIEDRNDGLTVVKFANRIESRPALDAIFAQVWLMEPHALGRMIAIAANAGEPERFEAAESWFLEEPRSPMRVENGDAVISISGPIFPKANIMTKHSGASSLAMIEVDIAAALLDDSVERLVLDIDSPGGVATGIEALANEIYAARERKPIVAVAQDMAASAAYWLGSAAGEFGATGSAKVGSIGVVLTAYRSQQYDDEVVIISRQSPKKRQDPKSESGQADLQVLADATAAVFVADVARNRDTTEHDVLENFGQGGLLAAVDAVAAGMVDGISSRQSIMATQGAETMPAARMTAEKLATDHPDIAEALREEGRAELRGSLTTANAEHEQAIATARVEAATAERERIQAVFAQSMPGHEALIEQLAFDGKTTGEQAAIQVLQAVRVANESALGSHREDAPAPAAVTPTDDTPSSTPASTTQDHRPVEDRCKDAWDKDASLRAEFLEDLDAYVAYTKAKESGRVRILKNKTDEAA